MDETGIHTDRFVDAFLASLALFDERVVHVGDVGSRRGVKAVVRMVDERARIAFDAGSVRDAAPWVEVGNQLRASATGGIGRWMQAMARSPFARIDDGPVLTVVVDHARARSEIGGLDEVERSFALKSAHVYASHLRG